ncbi:hypothetical protein K438DRAFT_1757234 [Mycena galopus ATCC 62051]|nr:hypothetical protein K438DRAFT_1757234 [Mycena galopus ATCC 62051]
MANNSTKSKPSAGKRKTKVNFGANGTSRKRKASPDAAANSSTKKPRTSTGTGASTPTGTTPPARGAGASTSSGGGAASAPGAASNDSTAGTSGGATGTGTNDGATETARAKRMRNPWGIRPKEVPEKAKPTQRAFQRFIRGLSGLLTQADVLPSASEAQTHYDKRFDGVDDYREQMRTLVDESRTAVQAATKLATKLKIDSQRIPGPITNDIARIPETHFASVFTMIQKAGLRGFCPDVEGPAQSTYNQLHRHLAVSGFQFLSSSLALSALDVNSKFIEDTDLLCDMYDNFVYGTLAQKTKMERRNPGSLSQSLKNSVESKARARLSRVRFDAANRLGLRKPVQRMAFIEEAHSDDEHTLVGGQRSVRKKPGRNPVVGKFFRKVLDVEAEAYRKRNAKAGQKAPKTRTRNSPLLPASELGTILPPNVPVDWFTPEYYNALSLKERARYVNTGVAFPLEDFVFDEAHDDWEKMGKQEFMEKYGNDVLELYDIPSAEEIDGLRDSDAEDDEEEVEIDLEDTDDEEAEEMEVDEDLQEE